MIEIVIMIGVIRAFARKANAKGLNKTTWGILGALSYYVPILVSTALILPLLYEWGVISWEGYAAFGMNVGINLALGIACCFGLYQYLRHIKTETRQHPGILDDF